MTESNPSSIDVMIEHMEREAFERFVTSPPFEYSAERMTELSAWPGNYRSIAVQLAWAAWQARAALASKCRWQPIETAPKDCLVLLFRPSAYEFAKIGIGSFNDDCFSKRPRPYWRACSVLNKTQERKWVPTHWMPLPEAPKG